MRRSLALLLAGGLALACAQGEATDEADHGQTNGPGGDDQQEAEILPATVVEATHLAPEYIQHATAVEIIPDVYAGLESASNTFTHEGNFGPLLFGEDIRSFYIRLEPGMFLAEHPHPTESLVFTVSGRWVLCSEGKRQVMEAGSTFHFGSNAPTGWEAPFPEGAFLYIVKSYEDLDYESYTTDIRNMATELDQQMSDGSVFYYHQLPPDHEAIRFAREHNPNFDEILARRN
jgi:quercetin dioxygenase-like cupin family protein